MLRHAHRLDHASVRRLAGWTILGVAAAGAELALLGALYQGLHVALPVATALAAETLILVKFVVADRWVFGHPRPALDRAIRYHGACAGALVVYWLVMNALAVGLGVVYTLAFLLGTAASFLWSLLTNFFWVWARTSQVSGSGGRY